MIIGIIGAGASGMAAALAASENENVQVILWERQARVGRKLAATGNGRCNLTNMNAHALPYMNGQGDGYYHGTEPSFVRDALLHYGPDETLLWFRRMGLYTVKEESGRVYPYSDQANSVVDVLRFALDRPNIRLLCGREVKKVSCKDGAFLVTDSEESIRCDKLIVACGGIAGSKLGGTMSGYQLLRSFGHHCTKLRPSLVQLKSNWHGCAALKGVRANCSVMVLHNGQLFAECEGELQFTEYGLSGPVIFEVSRDVCSEKGVWVCSLNLLPGYLEEDLEYELMRRKATNLLSDELLTGILHNRLGRVISKEAGVKSGIPIKDIPDTVLREVARLVKEFDIQVTEPMGMDSAQVTAGGILTSEFNPETMESKLVPGLYACGEVLDIDGACGGFNLQWAWSSGRLAGESAGKE